MSVTDKLGWIKVKECWFGTLFLFPPTIKVTTSGHGRRYTGVVKIKESLLIYHDVAPPGFIL